MRSKLATLRTFCAFGAAFVALPAGAQIATPRKAVVKHAAKAPARVSQAKQPVLPIAPWPPARETIGAPILPTQYPNVFVRFAPAPPAVMPRDASIYLPPGATISPVDTKPRINSMAGKTPFVPFVVHLPGGGVIVQVDPGRMEYMTADRDANGRIVVHCLSPGETSVSKNGGRHK